MGAPAYEPTPDEIAAEAAKIREEWQHGQRPKKSVAYHPYTPRVVRDPKLTVLSHRSWR